jgi:hypothetical protein
MTSEAIPQASGQAERWLEDCRQFVRLESSGTPPSLNRHRTNEYIGSMAESEDLIVAIHSTPYSMVFAS